ncbi:MAG TPA: Rossman fold protein, TIGR00730 family, partial [Ilumatobacteraceae bacterium]|nr:Rossman fold protein, TIGR00730 family [Ilumatobacteraceae bacterium]
MDTDVSDSTPSQARSIVSELGVSENVRLSEALVSEALGLITDQPDTLDLKIATAALAEMRDAYAMFAPYKQRRKVSIFGSARTRDDDPLYELTVALARRLAERGWMAVTGAGPGIMQAG